MEDTFAIRTETNAHGNSVFYGPDGTMVGACGIVKSPERVQHEKFLHAALSARHALTDLLKVLLDDAMPGGNIAAVAGAIDVIDSLTSHRPQP